MSHDLMILGANGMLGHMLFKYFNFYSSLNTIGILRDKSNLSNDPKLYKSKNIFEFNILEDNELNKLINKFKPEFIINCVGIVKQHQDANNPLVSIAVNSLFPHKLNKLCQLFGIKLIHISTDCIFSGKRGNYTENDYSDSSDLYGRSKFLGEINTNNGITLRTSYIGEELVTKRGLLSWFLSQEGIIKGFSKAIYSGLTTLEIAKVIEKFVLPNKSLKGIYHLSSNPIDKYSLLNIIKKEYEKDVIIVKDKNYKINRSLNSSKFQFETGYKPLKWEKSIKLMRDFK